FPDARCVNGANALGPGLVYDLRRWARPDRSNRCRIRCRSRARLPMPATREHEGQDEGEQQHQLSVAGSMAISSLGIFGFVGGSNASSAFFVSSAIFAT